jgi:DNA modification methylase
VSAPKVVLRTEQVPVADLKPYPGNARRGDVELVAESLRENGQYKPIVVQESTGYVLAGNHTLQAAIAEGWSEILATFVEVDDDRARKINLVDNRSNDVAGYDDEALAELLRELDGDLSGTGFEQVDVDALMAELGPGGWSSQKKDAAPPLPVTPVTEPGEVFALGPHRLVCGDALDLETVRLALDNQQADLVLTDPPYMVAYQAGMTVEEAIKLNRRTDGLEVSNDALSAGQADEFIREAMASVKAALKPGGVFYVFAPPGVDELRFRLGLRDCGLELREVLLWIKDRFVFGRQDYHWRHESVMYGWREGAAHHWAGGHSQDTLLEFDRPGRSKEHPTMKPVALLERLVENSSKKGQLIFDPFAGSGSTMVAAAAQGRRCAMVELDPRYCDVIIERWAKLTGEVIR